MLKFKHRQIRFGSKTIDAFWVRLQSKNFILLRGARGYCMCGYLDLAIAEKFSDVAVKITGVSSITQALKGMAASCTPAARKLGIHPGQPVKEILKIIA